MMKAELQVKQLLPLFCWQVYLEAGFAYVPVQRVVTIVVARFRSGISRSLIDASNHFAFVTSDSRFGPLLQVEKKKKDTTTNREKSYFICAHCVHEVLKKEREKEKKTFFFFFSVADFFPCHICPKFRVKIMSEIGIFCSCFIPHSIQLSVIIVGIILENVLCKRSISHQASIEDKPRMT